MQIRKHYIMRLKSPSTKGILWREVLVQAQVEPAFLAEHEEALLAADYIKQSRGGQSGRSGNNRGIQHSQAQQHSEKMNPVGPDGKIHTCRYCGSYRHFVAECPHNADNMLGSDDGHVRL